VTSNTLTGDLWRAYKANHAESLICIEQLCGLCGRDTQVYVVRHVGRGSTLTDSPPDRCAMSSLDDLLRRGLIESVEPDLASAT